MYKDYRRQTRSDTLTTKANYKCSSGGSSRNDNVDQMNMSAQSFAGLNTPIPFCQASLNDLVRNLNLPKDKAELLGQTLRDHNILASDCNTSFYRNRQVSYAKFFIEEDDITFCHDIE